MRQAVEARAHPLLQGLDPLGEQLDVVHEVEGGVVAEVDPVRGVNLRGQSRGREGGGLREKRRVKPGSRARPDRAPRALGARGTPAWGGRSRGDLGPRAGRGRSSLSSHPDNVDVLVEGGAERAEALLVRVGEEEQARARVEGVPWRLLRGAEGERRVLEGHTMTRQFDRKKQPPGRGAGLGRGRLGAPAR